MASRILVVDDNAVNLRLAAQVLLLSGYLVETAADAEQAQEYLAVAVPDLILMDLALPGMDGLALTRLIRSDARLRHIPVAALTAFAMKGDDVKAFEAGCDAYITKPIDTRKFPAQVAELIARGAAPR